MKQNYNLFHYSTYLSSVFKIVVLNMDCLETLLCVISQLKIINFKIQFNKFNATAHCIIQ